MDLVAIGIGSLWAGLFAGGLGILLTAPPRYLASAFLCGYAGRFVRDVFIARGLTPNWSTAVAAAVVVLVAATIIRKHDVPPVVVITGVLPLGAAVAMFNAIVGLMKVSSLQGEALSDASVAWSASLGKACITSLAIALGLAAGMAIVRVVRREQVWETT